MKFKKPGEQCIFCYWSEPINSSLVCVNPPALAGIGLRVKCKDNMLNDCVSFTDTKDRHNKIMKMAFLIKDRS